MTARALILAFLFVLPSSAWLLPSAVADDNWPAWRGPRGDGTSDDVAVPLEWNATPGAERNLAWKAPLAGSGHASPIVWGDAVFVAAADDATQERTLTRLDRRDGHEVWRRTVLTTPLEEHHPLNGYASSTPATDGERIYVSFLDRDVMFVAAYDFAGREVWAVRPGPFASKHGYCSSPVLFDDLVLVNGDHDGESFLAALDRSTGATRWKVARENHTRSYSVPLVRTIGGAEQLLLSGNKCVAGYDPRTGRQLWTYAGPTEQFVASVVTQGDVVLLTCGYPERHIMALRPGDGVLTESSVVWRTTRGAAYVPSPILVGELFFVVGDNGIVNCFRASTGEVLWTQRVGQAVSASLVAAGPRVYCTDDEGLTTVFAAEPEFRRLAENPLGEPVRASAAISDGCLFLRGDRHLFCIRAAKE